MKKHFTYLTLFFMVVTAFSYGQKNKYTLKAMVPEKLEVVEGISNINSSASLKSLFSAIDGTYQIQITDANYNALLSQSLYDKIVVSRKKYEDVSLVLDNKSKLFLPAYSKIEKSSFMKLKKSIYLNK